MALGAVPAKRPGSAVAAVKKPAAPVTAAKKAAAAPGSSIGKKGKDYTWGGRPNPTPETRVEEKESFLSASWRYNQK